MPCCQRAAWTSLRRAALGTMINKFPLWKNLLALLALAVGVIYSLPNFYGTVPSLQVSGRSLELETLQLQVEATLEQEEVATLGIYPGAAGVEALFPDEASQQQAQQALQDTLGKAYTVALGLAPKRPQWLRKLGADPMFLGLDLRGGVHFLMEVDMEEALRQNTERQVSDIRILLRGEKIRYRGITANSDNSITVKLRNGEDVDSAQSYIGRMLPNMTATIIDDFEQPEISLDMEPAALAELRQQMLQQNVTTLRKRVNELGVSEPIVQQHGLQRVVVQLPGIRDTTRAKDVLGATATLDFRMVDEVGDVDAAEDGIVPVGSRLYRDRSNSPHLLKKELIVTGENIINATSGIAQDDSSPAVFITLDGRGARIMSKHSRDHLDQPMAVVFRETTSSEQEVDGETKRVSQTTEEIISIATIREQLGKRFQISGLDSQEEARNLALLLRAGSLSAPIEIVEERTVGPSLGQENIDLGFLSVKIGLALVLIFMVLHYRWFGLIADIALACNLMLLVALLSMLQATLTLPGIAGIVLTVGMAVDANVLIFARIREELRNGNSPQAAIKAGYEKAFSTIADANITTLIAAVVLFSFGTGPIKGFAVTLSLGILTSMFSAILLTRAMVNLAFGGRNLQKLTV